MYFKIQKYYSASSDSGGTVTLDVANVKNALSKFDNLEKKINKITNVDRKAVSVKPSDLLSKKQDKIDLPVSYEQIKMELPFILFGEESDFSAYSNLVIDRVRKLCDDIIKADNLQLTKSKDDVPLEPTESDSISSDKDKNPDVDSVISDNEDIAPDKGQYTIENIIIGVDSDGNKITITPGNYDIVDTKKDANGNVTDICIIVNGEKIWISLKDKSVTSKEEEIVNNGQYTIEEGFTITDKYGNKITISPGNYDIVDTKKDANGNVTDICIIVNGEKIWISLKDKSVTSKEEIVNNGQYTIEEGFTITDKYGNKITISSGNYDIVDTKKDANGNVTDICIIVNGEKIWISLKDKNVISRGEEIVNNGQYTIIDEFTIIDKYGNKITISPGNYDIVDIRKDSNGNVTAICIVAGENHVWLVIDNGQINNTLLQTSYDGIYVFKDVPLNIYDNNGNIIGTVTNGRYNVYEVIIDSNGKITWIRISKDGEPKYWINVYFQETDWGIFLTYEDVIKHDNGVLKLLDKNKNTLIGILGVLVVGVGAIMYAKKSKKNKNVDNGTFAVYEISEDENGDIDQVRVSPNDYADEYWIKF